jgi:DNA-binding CsgD family transcriptional regulator
VSESAGRAAADRIFGEISDQLATARLDTREVLRTVVATLSGERAGIWVGALLGKDPSTEILAAFDAHDPAISAYLDAFMAFVEDPAKGLSGGISRRVIESGEPLLLSQVSLDSLLSMISEVAAGYVAAHPPPITPATLDVLIVPMRARGATIGALGVFDRGEATPLTRDDAIWLQAVADRAGLAIDNAQLYEDAVSRLGRLRSLEDVGLAVTKSQDLRLTLNLILDQAVSQLRVDAADLLVVDEVDKSLLMVASTGFLSTLADPYRVPIDQGLPGGAEASRRIVTVTALGAFSQFRRRSLFTREGFQIFVSVPLIVRDTLLGVLEVFRRSPLKADPEWLSFLDALASEAAIAIESSSARERLRHLGLEPAGGRRPPDSLKLTAQETRILPLVARGLTNSEIAAQLNLSQNTVKSHVRQILEKTGAVNRTDLARKAAREGWS